MKKNDILCAVDFSESSINALNWSFELAKTIQAKVVVMFCYRLITAIDEEETLGLKRKIEKEAILKFKEYERRLDGQSVPYRLITEVGFYHFRIETFLQQNPVGLLVMGNSVVENFDEYKNVGFEKFLSNCKIPVVVVPHEILEPIAI